MTTIGSSWSATRRERTVGAEKGRGASFGQQSARRYWLIPLDLITMRPDVSSTGGLRDLGFLSLEYMLYSGFSLLGWKGYRAVEKG